MDLWFHPIISLLMLWSVVHEPYQTRSPCGCCTFCSRWQPHLSWDHVDQGFNMLFLLSEFVPALVLEGSSMSMLTSTVGCNKCRGWGEGTRRLPTTMATSPWASDHHQNSSRMSRLKASHCSWQILPGLSILHCSHSQGGQHSVH